MNQISFFDGSRKFTFDKPIRLIELFAGIGSQAKALTNLNVPYEHYKISEWDIYSMVSYNAIHIGDWADYSGDMSREQLTDSLYNFGISANGKEPMSYQQIGSKPIGWLKTIYSTIKATNNVVSITNTHGQDLEITDTDEYCYVMTYSFPCQDLSKAGKGRGMARDSGTRSGLLWEVERLLEECDELPQVLLMENVPDVVGTGNIKHFAEWLRKLESLGYYNKHEILNAKNYGIPQNRERCFMVSILGDYYYEFPKPKKLDLRLADMLEDKVDESYYINDAQIEKILNSTFNTNANRIYESGGAIGTLCARDYKDPKRVRLSEHQDEEV